MTEGKDKVQQQWMTDLIDAADQTVVPRLREITASLMDRGKVFKSGDFEFEVISLLSNEAVGVVDAVITEGATFPFHHHDRNVVESIHVYQGAIMVEYASGDCAVIPRGQVHVIPNHREAHRVTSLDGHGDARMIAITVPRDSGFPRDE